MDYPRQIQLVRDIIQAQEVRLSKTLPGSEELTDEEMGIINELADHALIMLLLLLGCPNGGSF